MNTKIRDKNSPTLLLMQEVIDFLTKKKLINDNDLPTQTIHKLIEGLKRQVQREA